MKCTFHGTMKPVKVKNKDSGKEEFEMCQECGFPLIMSLRKGKRPWKFCFNPECKSNEEWVKKKNEMREKFQKGYVVADEDGVVKKRGRKKKVVKKGERKFDWDSKSQ